MGKKLGQSDDPLLVSVRSGAKFSMPGMMETVLNVGLNDQSVRGLAAQAGNERFAFDSYRRLIQMFGKTVLGIDGEHFEDALEAAKKAKGTHQRPRSRRRRPAQAGRDLQGGRGRARRAPVPAGPARADGPRRARRVRVVEHRPRGDLPPPGTHRRRPRHRGQHLSRWCSATSTWSPAPASPSPATRPAARRASTATTCRTRRARTSSPASATPSRSPISRRSTSKSYDELHGIMQTLEEHYRDLCDIEFTIERGKLWMLQTRVGKRTAGAAFRIATQLVDQGLIDMDEAVSRVTGAQLAQLMFPRFDDSARSASRSRKGMNASPGAAVGKVVFDSYTAVKWAASGEAVILVRRETNPDDLNGMIAAAGILTSRGGKTSPRRGRRARHGQDLRVRRRVARRQHQAAHPAARDSTARASRSTRATSSRSTAPPARCSSARYRSSTRRSCEYFEERRRRRQDDDLVVAVDRIMSHADGARRMSVRANADTAEDAARARRFGAQGIGLCRTEHMFLGERRQLVERLILADTDEEQATELSELLPLQREDFVGILEAMDGLPVTIRLLDPPLHEFLPDITELSVRVAVAEARGEKREGDLRMLQAVHKLHEQNPMLGLRGVRLGVVIPGLFEMQSRAILEAAAERIKARRRAARRDHGAARRERPGVRDGQAGHHPGRPRGARRDRRAPRVPRRHDDRAAARGADRRPDRRGGRVLLLRHQRPHPDDVGLLAATTSRPRSSPPTSRRASSASARSSRIDVEGVGELVRIAVEQGPLAPSRPQARRLRRARRRPRLRPLLRTRSASTTCRARRSACRWRASRPAAPSPTTDRPFLDYRRRCGRAIPVELPLRGGRRARQRGRQRHAAQGQPRAGPRPRVRSAHPGRARPPQDLAARLSRHGRVFRAAGGRARPRPAGGGRAGDHPRGAADAARRLATSSARGSAGRSGTRCSR